ncbi:hypothetical protein HanXRQr2_Chr12g0526001 [Helianthus annuus]|uniref:Disease resistance N-terminal domain-containing protein n=1 Tax=Helianthus annuus TaxID=4232 RepID=A0A9K3ENH9_HELAN|nr:hypothetical protein HanXRQr2_Chr12g0526001 [Helianthus annuus]
MSEIVFSAFLSVIFEKLASAALEKLAPYNDINSEKEITIRSVKRWLNDLQHLAYDIEDILADIATEATHREFTDKSEAHTSKFFLRTDLSKQAFY